MGKLIQIRNVPEEIHRILKIRAAPWSPRTPSRRTWHAATRPWSRWR